MLVFSFQGKTWRFKMELLSCFVLLEDYILLFLTTNYKSRQLAILRLFGLQNIVIVIKR